MSNRRILRIVVDTNVLISAVIAPGGFPDRVIRAWFLRHVSVLICRELFAAEWVDALDERSLPVSSRDVKDNKFLACALGARADYLVSGDADLLVLNGDPALGKTRIVTPRELITLLYPAEDSQ
jgi:predicted nucleic acid-binding protein